MRRRMMIVSGVAMLGLAAAPAVAEPGRANDADRCRGCDGSADRADRTRAAEDRSGRSHDDRHATSRQGSDKGSDRDTPAPRRNSNSGPG